MRLDTPVRLRAVLVGLVDLVSGGNVEVKCSSGGFSQQRSIEGLEGLPRDWIDPSSGATHVANGFDIVLEPPEAVVMLQASVGTTCHSSVHAHYDHGYDGDNVRARVAGPFSVISKSMREGILLDTSYGLCMSLVYEDVV